MEIESQSSSSLYMNKGISTILEGSKSHSRVEIEVKSEVIDVPKAEILVLVVILKLAKEDPNPFVLAISPSL